MGRVVLSSAAMQMTTRGTVARHSSSLKMAGIPATGSKCFGVSEDVMGNKRDPGVAARMTAHICECVLGNQSAGIFKI